ncbi:hypothetical protein [Rhizohabitans arisaemae]|uniref:hypothetical protein n=1 Tax=Rhizohabitans arisaemae TaxID=2720610 RepID=UPI0024B2186D|nr:hypothetical protein [Rhizohabitans arisaemae]
MKADRTPLAAFEERRLVELKEHIAGRAAAEQRSRPRRRLFFGAASLAGAGLATAITIVSLGGTVPAYAVTTDADGVVHAEVRDFRDAAGLTKRLKELGVPAVVDYVPHGQKCRGPRGTFVEGIPAGLYEPPTGIPGEKDGLRMKINPKLFKPGQSLVWTMTVHPDGVATAATVLMQGPVAPCVLVPDETKEPLGSTGDPGKSLPAYQVDGKTVGEVLPELKKRGLKVVYEVVEAKPLGKDRIGVTVDKQYSGPIGKDWTVVQGWEHTPGEFKLVVSEKPLS